MHTFVRSTPMGIHDFLLYIATLADEIHLDKDYTKPIHTKSTRHTQNEDKAMLEKYSPILTEGSTYSL